MYKERKAIEAAAYLLKQKEDATMDYYSLIKLLYLADREQVKRRGRTLTGDAHWSLPWGPVLENVLDAVKKGDEDWKAHLRTDLAAKTSTLVQDAPPAALSRADLEVLQAVWDEFGHLDGPALMRHTHSLPEYTPTRSRNRITLRSIAIALGKSKEEVRQIVELNEEKDDISAMLGPLNKASTNV